MRPASTRGEPGQPGTHPSTRPPAPAPRVGHGGGQRHGRPLLIDAGVAGQPTGGTGPARSPHWSSVNTFITGVDPGGGGGVGGDERQLHLVRLWVIGAVAIRPSACAGHHHVADPAGSPSPRRAARPSSAWCSMRPDRQRDDRAQELRHHRGHPVDFQPDLHPANWNVAQTVTVTGDDGFIDGNVALLGGHRGATSTDANYNGFNASDVGDQHRRRHLQHHCRRLTRRRHRDGDHQHRRADGQQRADGKIQPARGDHRQTTRPTARAAPTASVLRSAAAAALSLGSTARDHRRARHRRPHPDGLRRHAADRHRRRRARRRRASSWVPGADGVPCAGWCCATSPAPRSRSMPARTATPSPATTSAVSAPPASISAAPRPTWGRHPVGRREQHHRGLTAADRNVIGGNAEGVDRTGAAAATT